ncbi:MAG: SDR family oxidoreductase [Rhodobacter sp.]|nr:SDR family oxidoreductase [Rhodobacter sp.]MCA3514094.1 SDR family oxidoreductase [Rhodobacter sp.]MCA3520165.1 SDR family oxidoreductase [Rhodobacter sp.]MCA3522096.1 SDR family oxidoreductase [Rhodobacter sp.]MCA3524671.1 SDR family oxidoreductase [Rhodobacter sp.]
MRQVLITGGGGGIGAALSAGFAALGDHVIVLDRDGAAARAVAARLAGDGGSAEAVTCDLTDEAQTARMLAGLGKGLDVLINNAGIEARAVSGSAGFGADWRRVMAVNLDGAAYLSQAALPLLERAQGCIINIASIQSYAVLHTANTVYTVSKAALAQLTRAMAVEYAPRGVRVNAIAPGVVETPMIRQAGQQADRFRLFLDRIPMKRFALAEEIFGPAQFLASSGAAYVTGIILPVDGGFLAM